MNYTENYHLPQWEETDRIMRTDFNQMCADMEAGLKQNAQAAATALSAANSKPTSAAVNQAQTTANQALSAANAAQTAADNAQTTANTAVSAADAAQTAADAAQETADAAYCPAKMPYTVGSYTGNGSNQPITLGFRPQFVIITGQVQGDGSLQHTLIAGAGILPNIISFTNSGFWVTQRTSTAGQAVTPSINLNEKEYSYIAFR